jgi:hypothetical protein
MNANGFQFRYGDNKNVDIISDAITTEIFYWVLKKIYTSNYLALKLYFVCAFSSTNNLI